MCIIFVLMIITDVSYAQIRSLDLSTSMSPIWDRSIRDAVKLSKLTTAELNNLRSRYLVPGKCVVFCLDSCETSDLSTVFFTSAKGHPL